MNTNDLKIAAPVAAFISVVAAIAYTQLRNEYPSDIVDFQNYIETRGTLSTADYAYPATLPQKSFKMELESCVLRVEATYSEQEICANTAIPDRQWFFRTEFQLSEQLEIESIEDDSRGTFLLLFSVRPNFKNGSDFKPMTKSGTLCDGRRAEVYRSKDLEWYIYPKDTVNGLDQAIQHYIKEFC